MRSDDLITMIADAFEGVRTLGSGHTLAACDYYDNWRWFPEDGDLRSISGRPDAYPSFEGWPKEVECEILTEISKKEITNKSYTFLDVDGVYLDFFCDGIHYLDQREFKFYLAAWMINLILDRIDSGSLINLYFFNRLEAHHLICSTYKTIEYDEKQLSAVANFLLFHKNKNGDFCDDGANCLYSGWAEYLSESQRSRK